MRMLNRMVTASFVVVTLIGSTACENTDSTSPATTVAPEALRVSVSPKLDTLVAGGTRQLTARVYNAQNETRAHAVDWRSENPSVASISTSGLIAAVSAGVTRIIASAGGAPDTATIVVLASAPPIAITPGAVQVVLGDSLSFTLSSTGAAGSMMAASTARWTTSDPNVATVSADGVVTTINEGAATISADVSGSTASADVQVVNSPVSSVTVSPPNTSIVPGATQQLTATAFDSHGRVTGKGVASWSSSADAIARVSSDGLVTGVAKGVAIITVQIQKRKATAVVNVLDVPAATVTVSLAAATLSVGQTTQGSVVLKDAQGTVLTGRTVAWQSSNPALATVNASGLVSALAKGSVTISAICDGKVGAATLTVSSPTPTTIVIAPTTVSLKTGQSTQLAAQVRDANGVIIPNRPITWSSANASVAAINASGALTGLTVGSTDARATADGLTASAPVTITAITAASVTVSPSTVSLTVGDSASLSAVVRDGSGAILADRAVNWSTSDHGVANVSVGGMVTATGPGSATITGQVDGVTATVAVTVKSPPPAPVASIAVTLTPSSLTVGQNAQATATLRDASGNVLTGRSLTWSSANPEVVTISATGAITAVSAGSASVVAASEGQSGAATITVTAPAPAPVATVSLSASSTTLAIGATMQTTVTLKDAAGNVLSGRTIGWTSSNTTVATVSATGLVKAVTAGTVTITASSEGKTGSLGFTVSPAPVAAVAVTLGSISLQVGQTTQASARLTDAAGNVLTGRTLVWSSSAPVVATVSSSGVVTALSAGTANIVATSEGKTGSAAVSVTAPAPPPTDPPVSCSLVSDLLARPVSAMAKPGYLQWGTEPDFRTPIWRITGDPGTAIGGGVAGSWGSTARHDYPKKQPWSADGKLFSVDQMGGAVGPGVQLFLDGDTYQPLFARAHPGPEARWHPTVPDVQIYVASNGSVGHWNARTNAATVKVSVSGYSNASMGDYEGNPSYDGRYVVVTATRSDGRLVAFAVDIDGGTKYPDIDLAANGVSSMDWASISAKGTYVVVLGVIDGRGQTSKIFTRQGALVASWPDNPLGHSDLGIDASGNEVIFGAASGGTYSKRFLMRRLDNGQVTPLTPATTWDWHSSTRAYRRPGWALAVTNDAAGSVFDREIYWVKLDGSGTVQRLATHRSNNASNSNANPVAVPSPDGKRVAFASNWGGSAVQDYVIDTRSLCP